MQTWKITAKKELFEQTYNRKWIKKTDAAMTDDDVMIYLKSGFFLTNMPDALFYDLLSSKINE